MANWAYRQTVMALLSNWSFVNSIWVIALRRDETLMLPLPAGCNGSIRQALLPLSLQREINPPPLAQPCKHIVPDSVTFVVKHILSCMLQGVAFCIRYLKSLGCIEMSKQHLQFSIIIKTMLIRNSFS